METASSVLTLRLQIGSSVYQFPHPHFYPVKKLLIQGSTAFHGKIKSISNRIMDHNMIHILFPATSKIAFKRIKIALLR